ncbi:glycosyltransferase family 39 protein [Nocardia sp. NEAU-G5]|uniref:Glycosyltransferase family 39 protein n=1 Tax=Nocardia albiluteola TaxID=2842303 RepID=A0ABS6AYD8_9NOCA|nr:glycosyltransferase family 39 protein [Nocardia albiluteola]MBU3062038.1 glycosyltransferase family 39 protein [Nocardia albiluteola]
MTDVVERPIDDVAAAEPPRALAAVAAIAVASAAALLFSASRYGYFGDELYFLAAGRRLAWGYADQGPVLPLLARVMDTLVPGSYLALRLPAVALTVVAVVLCAELARRLGGSRVAQILAAAGYATSPFLLAQGAMLTTNAVDTALWVIITWLLVRWVQTRRDVLLLLAALVTAVDLQVKWLIPFFWAAVAVSALLVGPRELVRRPLLWAGGLIVLISCVPELLWQAGHGWPQLGMGGEISDEAAVLGGRLLFVPVSVALCGFLGTPLLLCGIWVLLRRTEFRPYRFLGATLILLYIAFTATGGRVYYPAGMYAVVIAAGAVGIVAAMGRMAAAWRRTVAIVLAALGIAGTLLIVEGAPWRPADQITPPRNATEAAVQIGLYGQFGWPELDEAVSEAYDALSPAERAHAAIIADTYWQASALDQLGRDHLPPIYSPSRGFGYFATPPENATAVIAVGGTEPALRSQFEHVTPIGKLNTRIGFPGNTQDVTIWKCTGRLVPWSAVWPRWMHL